MSQSTTEMWMGIRGIIRLYEKMLKSVCAEYQLTVIEADIISFLQNNPEKDTAADIVELRMLSKGAVSKAVESLLQKSLLMRQTDTQDRRRIHLKLRPEAGPIMKQIEIVQKEFRNTIMDGFTEEDMKKYMELKDRILANTRRAMERRD